MRVLVLAPMPLELEAIVTAFGLTRAALSRVFDATRPDHTPFDHVMIAGICGGLDPDLPVGTLVNPDTVIDHTSGATYAHTPPGAAPTAGTLITTEGVSLDKDQSLRFFEDGCIAVDMETSAVAEVCEANGCPWSVYRCISDRHFDGLLDERVINLANPDGSGNREAFEQLLAEDPSILPKLEQLGRDSELAARLAAEAAVRGCLALT